MSKISMNLKNNKVNKTKRKNSVKGMKYQYREGNSLRIVENSREIIPEQQEVQSPLKSNQISILKHIPIKNQELSQFQIFNKNLKSLQLNIQKSKYNGAISQRTHYNHRYYYGKNKQKSHNSQSAKKQENKSIKKSPYSNIDPKNSPLIKNIFQISQDKTQGSNSTKSIETPKINNNQISQFFQYASVFKSERKRIIKKKIRIIIKAITFIRNLRRYARNNALKRKQDMEFRIIKINQIIQKMVCYYNLLLRQQLNFYVKIIKKFVENQQFEYKQYVFKLIEYISIKLEKSKATNSTLDLFKLIAFNKGYIPSGFFFQFQINRLEISQNYGCLVQMTQQQSMMIIGIFLCVQILCFYILYRPWSGIKDSNLKQADYYKYRQVVKDIASVLYYMVLEEFKKIPIIKRSKGYNIYDELNIQCQRKLVPQPIQYHKQYYQDTNTRDELIANQNCNFFQRMTELDDQRMFQIKERIMNWFKGIYKAAIKHQLKPLNL